MIKSEESMQKQSEKTDLLNCSESLSEKHMKKSEPLKGSEKKAEVKTGKKQKTINFDSHKSWPK